MLLVAMEMTRATGLLKTEKNSKCKNRHSVLPAGRSHQLSSLSEGSARECRRQPLSGALRCKSFLCSFFPLSSHFACLFFSDLFSVMPTLLVVPASLSFFKKILPFVSWSSAFSSTQGIFMMLFVRLCLRSPSSLSHICNFLLAMGNIADNPWWLSGKESTC